MASLAPAVADDDATTTTTTTTSGSNTNAGSTTASLTCCQGHACSTWPEARAWLRAYTCKESSDTATTPAAAAAASTDDGAVLAPSKASKLSNAQLSRSFTMLAAIQLLTRCGKLHLHDPTMLCLHVVGVDFTEGCTASQVLATFAPLLWGLCGSTITHVTLVITGPAVVLPDTTTATSVVCPPCSCLK